jgi:holliday junction DNA helicase RuvB
VKDKKKKTSRITRVASSDAAFRPKKFSDFVGQSRIKRNLSVYVKSALNRSARLDHTLLCGSAGLGKTSMAEILAEELNRELIVIMGPHLSDPAQLGFLYGIDPQTVVFIDEIHAVSKSVEEVMYPAMEDFKLQSGDSDPIQIPEFTIIGATTKEGLLSKPFRDRFGIIEYLDFYNLEDMKKIVERTKVLMKLNMTDDALVEIAARTRGVPRIANSIIKRIRDFACAENNGVIDLGVVKIGLDALGVDNLGLNKTDQKILITLATQFNGGPAGIQTLAHSSFMDVATVENVVEPFLMKMNLITRHSRGRVLTKKGVEHLKKIEPTLDLEAASEDMAVPGAPRPKFLDGNKGPTKTSIVDGALIEGITEPKVIIERVQKVFPDFPQHRVRSLISTRKYNLRIQHENIKVTIHEKMGEPSQNGSTS